MSVSKIKGFIPINNGDVDVRSRVNREKGSEETYFEKEDLLKAESQKIFTFSIQNFGEDQKLS